MGLFRRRGKKKKTSKFRDKLQMYDMIAANLIAGRSIIEPTQQLDSTQIAIGFNNIASETQISKYFIIRQFPDYLQPRIVDAIRSNCIRPGIKMNFYFHADPYRIKWESAEMKNKMDIWRRYSQENAGDPSVWEYRHKRADALARDRIIMSTKYLNEAELDHKRSLMSVTFVIEVTAQRNDDDIINMIETIHRLKRFCYHNDIKLRELRVNMMDWLQVLGIFKLTSIKEVDRQVSKKILTDDLLANFNSYKQGRVGETGVSLGIDIMSGVPVLKKFKADPDAAENWLIAAETGGGKSYFVKTLLTYLLADGFVITVMDYEGDEYTNMASYIRAGNPEDVRVVSMGKGSTNYFDPTPIPDLTGDPDVDEDLKETAISFIMAIFRVIVSGLDGNLTQWEERVISTAIQRVYDSAGVTEDKNTWHRSKGLNLHMIYDEIKYMVTSKELVDFDSENVRHKAAIKVQEAASVYFEEGEAKSGTFKNPLSADDLYKAKFIVFSFGMKGSGNSITDRTMLALKQLSVACISTQISNHCKYVKKCFNVKVWEEFQRWGDAKGSSEIILNAMTGGRKRGDVNIVITNDLSDILAEGNPVSSGIRQNIQNLAIGKVQDKSTRRRFCDIFDIKEMEVALDRIARAHGSGAGNRYEYAFCVMLDTGKKAITKVMLPPSLQRSKLFKTGVDVEGGNA